MPDLIQTISANIQKLSKRRGLTRSTLGFKCGTAWPVVDRYWRGQLKQIDPVVLERMAVALECTSSDLCSGD